MIGAGASACTVSDLIFAELLDLASNFSGSGTPSTSGVPCERVREFPCAERPAARRLYLFILAVEIPVLDPDLEGGLVDDGPAPVEIFVVSSSPCLDMVAGVVVDANSRRSF